MVFRLDVAPEAVLLAQRAGDADDLLHRVVRAADDPGRQEQALDVVAPVEVERQPHDLLDREGRARGTLLDEPVDAIQAVVGAGISSAGSSAARCSARPARRNGRSPCLPWSRAPCRRGNRASAVPLDAQDASYFAASARIASFRRSSMSGVNGQRSGQAICSLSVPDASGAEASNPNSVHGMFMPAGRSARRLQPEGAA